MDLLNVTNRAQIHELINTRVKWRKQFYKGFAKLVIYYGYGSWVQMHI